MTPDQIEGLKLREHIRIKFLLCPSWESLLYDRDHSDTLVDGLEDLYRGIHPNLPTVYKQQCGDFCAEVLQGIIDREEKLKIEKITPALRRVLRQFDRWKKGKPFNMSATYLAKMERRAVTRAETLAIDICFLFMKCFDNGAYQTLFSKALALRAMDLSVVELAGIIRNHVTDLRPLVATVRLLK